MATNGPLILPVRTSASVLSTMTIDLDRPIQDELILRTLPGAVDYLVENLRHLDAAEATVLRRYRNGLQIRYEGPLRPLSRVRYFDICAIPVQDDVRGLAASQQQGVLSALDTAGPLRFRVADLGDQRWSLREQLETVLGWANSANDWQVNVDRFNDLLVAEAGPLFLTQRFGELERMPASTNPLVAAVMVRLAKLEPGGVVLDPFCGAGTLLTMAGETTPELTLIGCDQNARWLSLARRNLERRGLRGQLIEGDAQQVPLDDGSIERVISNLPFGKRIGSHANNKGLYPAALREIARLMHGRSRAVLLTDDKRLFKESVQRTPLIRVVKEIMLEQHGGLHPTAYVISKRGGSGRR
jgi:SAM-dependent methyltransferase